MAIKKYLPIADEGNGGNIDNESPAAVGIEWEGQPGPRNLKNKKIEAHDKYAKNLENMISTYMQAIYSILKELRDICEENPNTTKDTAWLRTHLLKTANQIFPLIQRIRSKTYDFTKQYAKDYGELPPKAEALAKFCYDEDENELKKRFTDVYSRYAEQAAIEKNFRVDTMMHSLFGLTYRIADTEAMYLSNHLLKEVEFGEFGEYVSGENCTSNDPNGICDQYCNGIHPIARLYLNMPPFHPNCHCFAVYYTIDELNDSNKEEKEE